MTASGPWVCGNCRSVNRESATRCYSCRTPRALALDPTGHDATPHRFPKDAEPVAQAGVARSLGATYRDSSALAALAQVAVLLVTAITLARVVLLVIYLTRIQAEIADPATFDPAAEMDGVFALLALRYVELGAWLAGLACWGLWLARVVANVPALGGGWPHETPRFAFLSTLIPGGNLYWTTSTLREAITALSPAGAPRLGLITAWWLAVTPTVILLLNVGPLRWLRSIVEGLVTTFLVVLSGGINGIVESVVLVELVGGVLLVVAAALAVLLVQLVERLQAERLAEVGAPAAA